METLYVDFFKISYFLLCFIIVELLGPGSNGGLSSVILRTSI